ncbi:MAG: response regulator [Alphaproteobacteria bacterium]|nr:response regulator [Alphaproteobacteria bacterium]
MSSDVSESGTSPQELQSVDLSLTTALIIEDQPQILSLIADCLKVLRVGHVLPVANAQMAQEVVTTIERNPSQVGISHIDFALIDWNLIGNPFRKEDGEALQGPDISRWLRQVEFCRFMPILGISAYSSKEILTDMIDGGVNGFVSKPFSIYELSRHIQRIVSDIKPFIVTPSSYFGPDRRRIVIKVTAEQRRSQNGVRAFNPPRALRQKTANIVDIDEKDVTKVMAKMRDIAPPDYRTMVDINIRYIKDLLDETPQEVPDEATAKLVRANFDEINVLCNDTLGDPGGFTYQMIAETMASMSRFISDKYFVPTKQAHLMIRQQLATAEVIIQRDMKGAAKGEMRHLFSESFTVIKKVLKQNRNSNLQPWKY